MLQSNGPAELRYDTPDFHVLRRGSYVLCAVTGDRIPIDALLYWSVDYQEAYRDAQAMFTAAQAGGAKHLAK